MSEIENRPEAEAEQKRPAVPMWIWGVTTFVACYAVMQLQRMV